MIKELVRFESNPYKLLFLSISLLLPALLNQPISFGIIIGLEISLWHQEKQHLLRFGYTQ